MISKDKISTIMIKLGKLFNLFGSLHFFSFIFSLTETHFLLIETTDTLKKKEEHTKLTWKTKIMIALEMKQL